MKLNLFRQIAQLRLPTKTWIVFFVCLYFVRMFIFLSRESDPSAITSLLRNCRPPVYHIKMGESRQVPFLTTQQINLPACSPRCPFNAERQAGKLWMLILKSLVWPDSESNPSLQLLSVLIELRLMTLCTSAIKQMISGLKELIWGPDNKEYFHHITRSRCWTSSTNFQVGKTSIESTGDAMPSLGIVG